MKYTILAVAVATALLTACGGDDAAVAAPKEVTGFTSGKAVSSSVDPYIVPIDSSVKVASILTVGDAVGTYRMAGIPDGLGAYDNGDNTFTVLMAHELGNTAGIARAHGAVGAFVSECVILYSSRLLCFVFYFFFRRIFKKTSYFLFCLYIYIYIYIYLSLFSVP